MVDALVLSSGGSFSHLVLLMNDCLSPPFISPFSLFVSVTMIKIK